MMSKFTKTSDDRRHEGQRNDDSRHEGQRSDDRRNERQRSNDRRREGPRDEERREEPVSSSSDLIHTLVSENAQKSSECVKKQKLLDKQEEDLRGSREKILNVEKLLDGTKEALDQVKEKFTDLTEAIKSVMQCRVCGEHLMPPFKPCICGAPVCDFCISQVATNRCFYCNNVSPRIRNFQIETLAAKFDFVCPGCGPDRQCGERFLYENATAHTNKCKHTFLLLCPFDGCNASAGFNTESIKKHFLTEHDIEVNKCFGRSPNKYWQPNEILTIDIKNSPQLSGQTNTVYYLIETTEGIALMIHRTRDGFFSSTIYHFPDPAFGNQARFRYTMTSHNGNSEDQSSVTVLKFMEMPRWNGFLCDKSETEIKAIKQFGMESLELDQKKIAKFSHKGVFKLKITIEFKETNEIQNEGDMSPDMSSPKSPVYNDIFPIIANSTNLEGSSDDE